MYVMKSMLWVVLYWWVWIKICSCPNLYKSSCMHDNLQFSCFQFVERVWQSSILSALSDVPDQNTVASYFNLVANEFSAYVSFLGVGIMCYIVQLSEWWMELSPPKFLIYESTNKDQYLYK